jgi:hypothetical protein
MALKPDRIELLSDVSFFMSTTGTRGGVVSVSTASTGVGVAMDDANAVVAYSSNPSGAYPVGVLLNDVVNLDLTRQHINFHKDEVQLGGKVAILRKGQVTTNNIDGTPAAGQTAYLHSGGNVSATQEAGAVAVGQFLSAKDSDGYAKVSVNI